MTKLSYAEQLKHPFWQRKRLEVLENSQFRCERCAESERTLHVHHKRYVKGRMAWEYDAKELAALCESCHETAHYEATVMATLMLDLEHAGPYSLSEAISLVAGWSERWVNQGTFELRRYERDHAHQAAPYDFTLGLVAGRLADKLLLADLIGLDACFMFNEDEFVRRLRELIVFYRCKG